MKKRIIYAIVSIAAILGIYIVWNFYPRTATQTQTNIQQINILEAQKEYVGEISTSTDGMMLYRSKKLGLSFLFPQGWRIGDNHIMYGTFQIFTYPDTGGGKDFSPDAKINKIEAVIGKREMFNDEPSSDYPEGSRKEETVYLNGEKITIRDVMLMAGQQMRTYIIPDPKDANYLMHITIYGNPDNFYILDDLVQTIEWNR